MIKTYLPTAINKYFTAGAYDLDKRELEPLTQINVRSFTDLKLLILQPTPFSPEELDHLDKYGLRLKGKLYRLESGALLIAEGYPAKPPSYLSVEPAYLILPKAGSNAAYQAYQVLLTPKED